MEAYPTDSPSMKLVSIRKELELDLEKLKLQLEVKEQMLELLKENPAIEKFMNLSRGIL
jgi:hypothetical protein